MDPITIESNTKRPTMQFHQYHCILLYSRNGSTFSKALNEDKKVFLKYMYQRLYKTCPTLIKYFLVSSDGEKRMCNSEVPPCNRSNFGVVPLCFRGFQVGVKFLLTILTFYLIHCCEAKVYSLYLQIPIATTVKCRSLFHRLYFFSFFFLFFDFRQIVRKLM